MNIEVMERELEGIRDKGLALLKATAATAEKENREFTDEERAALKAVQDDGLKLKARIAKAKGDASMMEELERLTAGATATPKRSRIVSLGEQFVTSAAYDFIRRGGHKSGSSWRSPSEELAVDWLSPRGATLTTDPASGGSLVTPQYLPGILPIPARKLVVADLFAPGTTDSNQVVYMKEKTWVNAADTVLEGAQKPESTLTFESVSDPVRKIAHWLPVTEEMLEDVAQIRSYIDARLRTGVMFAEEDQLLNGSGVAPDLLGLLLRPGLAPPVARTDPNTNADAILIQIMSIFATSFLMPDGIVINPVDWVQTLLTKTTTGDYLTGGPFSPIQTPTLWGLPVAVTPATVAATAVVGAFSTGGQVFRKGGIRVEASNSHADFFIKNLVAIRAEERLALAVYRPQAFGTVTGLGPVTTP